MRRTMGPLLLALLQLTFVTAFVLLFHSLRKTVGSSPFYLSLGMFFVLGQLVASANLTTGAGAGGLQVNLGQTTLLAPYLVALLVVYVVDGTHEAQRLILGFVAALAAYYYLASVLVGQGAMAYLSSPESGDGVFLQAILEQSRRTVLATSVATVGDLFVLPVLFQFLYNRKARLFFAVLGTLVLTQVVDSVLFQIVTYPHLEGWWHQLRATYLARVASLLWLSALTTFYLARVSTETDTRRRPLDILLDFFRTYGQMRELRQSLREWEGRYRIVVQSTSDLIFIANEDGRVLNANPAALRALGLRPGEPFRLQDVIRSADDKPWDWADVWRTLREQGREGPGIPHLECRAQPHGAAEPLELDASVSRGELLDAPVAVVTARDVTLRRRLERERRQIEEQLVHAQRMEAVGQLAGGIAHDFNNLLLAIRGSLDGLARQIELSAPSRAMISTIEDAAARASELTRQLLGFARRGKYQPERHDLADLVQGVRSLFEPVAGRQIALRVLVAPDPMIVMADAAQLQQVFLNLLLNARDAIQAKAEPGGCITLRAEVASEHTPGWTLRPDPAGVPSCYVCVRVRDNGVGMTPEIRRNLFTPFFTTKGVGKGIGMGLAMAYGCVANHHGWIHVETEPGKGSEFFVFLPRL